MPFQYEGWQNPYAASMADEIARSGDAAARAAQVIGQAQARATALKGAGWAHAVESIGQLPTQIAAQQTALTDRKLKEQELAMTVEDRTARAAQRVATSIGRIAGTSSSPEAFASAVDSATASGLLPPEIGQHVKGLIQQAGADPAAFRSLRQQYIDIADQFTAGVKIGRDEKIVRPSVDPTAPPTTIAQGAPGPPTEAELALRAGQGDPTATAAMDRLKPKPQPTEAGLAATAAGGDATAQAALDKLRAQKNPPSLEDQYLEAKAKGDVTRADTILHTWRDEANAKRDPTAQAQLEAIRRLTQQEAQARLDERDVTSPKNQQKFEQEYRTVLARGLSSRSGGLGLEDAKVQQANHLLALLDQTYDPKTDAYTIPKVLQGELAAGLARLVAPGGTVGVDMMREFNQRTAKGDLAGALTYLTGTPWPTATQDIAKMLRDSIERQGTVAEQNREGEMRYLRGLAPTDLSEERRTALESTSLNPLRQSRVIQNTQTGERKVQVSLDGGKSWK